MRVGAHDHLMFGEGEMDFVPIFRALRHINYSGPACVELSRHSHDAVRAATTAFNFLCPLHQHPMGNVAAPPPAQMGKA